MRRMLALAIGLVSLGETLTLHWAALTFWGEGLSWGQALLGLALLGAVNATVFPQIRRRIHARGLVRVLSRVWIFGSIAAIFVGVLLGAMFLAGGLGSAAGGEIPRTTFAWLGGAIVALGFGSVAWGASVGHFRVRVDHVSLPHDGVAPAHEALRIAHVTDLHIGPLLQPEQLRRFVARINALEADLVVLTGDLFDFDPAYIEDGCRELARLEAREGVFAVLGNHDVYTGADEIAEAIGRLSSIRLLRDSWLRLDVDGGPLAIVGIDDPGEGWTEREAEHDALERLAREIPTELPRILLAHRPSYFAHASSLGFQLVLSGHTHGGQVALPFAPNVNPSRMIAHRTRGMFRDATGTLYVSRGLGMAGLPLRINCPREIALLRLLASS